MSPVAQFKKWGLKGGVAEKVKATDIGLGDDFTLAATLDPLSGGFGAFKFTDKKVRWIEVAPSADGQGGKVQMLYKLRGGKAWKGPVDVGGGKSFCQDRKAEDVTDIVLILSNASTRTPVSFSGGIDVKARCGQRQFPSTWTGSITNDVTETLDDGYTHWRMTATSLTFSLHQHHDADDPVRDAVDWVLTGSPIFDITVDGVWGGCTVAGHFTGAAPGPSGSLGLAWNSLTKIPQEMASVASPARRS